MIKNKDPPQENPSPNRKAFPSSCQCPCAAACTGISVCRGSHELPMFVRGHMRMGMCVCARVHRKYIFVLLNKVETD